MKKCPFCAEEIQDEAIKCRYCQSFLSMAPPAADAGAPSPELAVTENIADPRPAASPTPTSKPSPLAPASRYTSEDEARDRRVLYQGSPSWRAYIGEYSSIVLGGVLVPFATYWVANRFDASGLVLFMVVAIPLALATLGVLILNLYRRSKVFRITTTNIETEFGLVTRKIDVLELWRCRDVRYRQSLFDRILRIAHIEIFTADVTTPNLCILGFPASRQLFENIRDSIEIQRQSRNVVGFVQ